MSLDYATSNGRAGDLESNKSVKRSFATLKPGIDFSSCDRKVRMGIFFQNKSVSSTLKMDFGEKEIGFLEEVFVSAFAIFDTIVLQCID